jgi:hypothetical protein
MILVLTAHYFVKIIGFTKKMVAKIRHIGPVNIF